MCSSHGAHMWKRTCQDSHYRNTIHWCLSILPTHLRGFPWTSFTCSKGWPKNGTRQWHEVRRVELVERWSVKSLKQMIWRVSNLAFQTTHLGFHGSSAGATPMKSLPSLRHWASLVAGSALQSMPHLLLRTEKHSSSSLDHVLLFFFAHLRPSLKSKFRKVEGVLMHSVLAVLGGQNDVQADAIAEKEPCNSTGNWGTLKFTPDRCLTSVSLRQRNVSRFWNSLTSSRRWTTAAAIWNAKDTRQ